MKRLGKVLDDEQIEYDKKVLAELIQKYYPDFKKQCDEYFYLPQIEIPKEAFLF